jgi:hypothetical protein
VLPLLTTEKYVSPALLKKFSQDSAAFFSKDADCDLKVMVKPSIPTNMVAGNHAATLGINRPENQPGYPGMNHGCSAHGARLQGHIEDSFRQTVIIKITGAPTKNPDLRMARRIAIFP